MSIDAAARRLGVTVEAVRLSTDVDDPHPAIEVLDALVREDGVDPTWLLTGEYDFAAHQRAIEGLGEFAVSPLAPLLEPENGGGAASSINPSVTSALSRRAPLDDVVSPESPTLDEALPRSIPLFPVADLPPTLSKEAPSPPES